MFGLWPAAAIFGIGNNFKFTVFEVKNGDKILSVCQVVSKRGAYLT